MIDKKIQKILKEIDDINDIYNKMLYKELKPLQKKLDKLRAEAKENNTCSHSDFSVYSYEHDNGYGRQNKVEYKKCNLCYAEEHYGKWRY